MTLQEVRQQFNQRIRFLNIYVYQTRKVSPASHPYPIPDDYPTDDNTWFNIRVSKDGCHAELSEPWQNFHSAICANMARHLVILWATECLLVKPVAPVTKE